MARARRMLVIVGIGAFLISGELLTFRSLNQSLDEFAHSMGNLLQRLNIAVGVVSAVTKPVPQHASDSGNFQWNWRDGQELKADQSLRNANLTNNRRKAIADAVADEIRPMMADLEIKSESELEKAALDTRISMVDLNGDGVPEVVAQGMVSCGATGNCPFWVFRKSKLGYEVLLEGEAQRFTIQRTSHSGFRDIVLSTHGSYSSGGLTNYQYQERAYKDVGCYNYEWAVLDGEVVRELKEPQVTPCR